RGWATNRSAVLPDGPRRNELRDQCRGSAPDSERRRSRGVVALPDGSRIYPASTRHGTAAEGGGRAFECTHASPIGTLPWTPSARLVPLRWLAQITPRF